MANLQLQFNIPFTDASTNSVKGLVISPGEFKDQFLWGIPLCSAATGASFPEQAMVSKLLVAQKFVENFTGLKLFKQLIEDEQKDFVGEEFLSGNGYIKANYPIAKIFSLTGNFNQQKVQTYPIEWLNFKRAVNLGDIDQQRNLYITPNGQGTVITTGAFFGQFLWSRGRIIPNYWHITYLTGFDTVPADLINLIGKIAAVQILPIIEMGITSTSGFSFGSASSSLSMDGLSQSISKANGGNVFQQRLQQYGREVLVELQTMKLFYSGIAFDVC
jgi:hypothetical protein